MSIYGKIRQIGHMARPGLVVRAVLGIVSHPNFDVAGNTDGGMGSS
jgi:hypothetical protein